MVGRTLVLYLFGRFGIELLLSGAEHEISRVFMELDLLDRGRIRGNFYESACRLLRVFANQSVS